jgi:outer membrane receptor protein involved in Fe transport
MLILKEQFVNRASVNGVGFMRRTTMIKGHIAQVQRKRLFQLSASVLPMLLLAGVPSAAHAQENQEQSEDGARPADIVVTGSRIARPVLDLPTPVGVVSAETLENNNAQFDIGRALAQQPAIGFSGSMQQNQQSGAAGTRGESSGGLAVIDLRSLGSNRTLVLVNGKRRVAGSTDSAAVDLNSINPNLIERVEIITGGASAIYGSDAVSGVVNIITKDKFEGLRLSYNGSQPTESNEGFTFGGSLIAGKNFDDGRGNITVAADYTKIKMITPRHADMHNYAPMNNPANTGTQDGIADQILVANAEIYRFSGYGAVGTRGDTKALGAYYFNDDGTARRAPTALFTDGSITGVYANCGTSCFRYDDTISIVPDIKRYNINGSAHYDVTNSIQAYLSVDYNNTSTFGLGQPVQQSAIPINIAQNAYLDPAFRQQLLAAGATTLQMDRSFFDVGLRTSRVDRHSISLSGGFKGKFETALSDLSYDIYGTYGRTEAKFTGYNRLITANYRAAIDAVVDPVSGIIKCRMDVPSLQPAGYVRPSIVGSAACSPFNPFGSDSSSEAARNFVRATTVSTAFIQQVTTGASVSGDSGKFLTLPGGGAIGIALGAEYREERNGRTNDALIKGGLTTQASSQDYTGSYHVSELFAELNVPLLTELPFAKLLSLEGAVRRADYSQSGNVTSWKGGAIWEPIDGLRLRGTLSHAIRAPNIFEAFRPTEGQTTNINDPCSQNFITLNPNRAANCATLGRPAGFIPANGGLGIPFTVSGNPDLKPEVSDSWTAGVSLSPNFLPGLQITADWFNIKIKDAISFLSGQDIANNCVDRAGGPDQTLCALISRDMNTASANFFGITGGNSTYVNTSKLMTSGLDTQLFYSHPLGAGKISTNLSLTYLHRFRTYTFQARPDLYKVLEGFLGYPRFKGVAAIDYAINAFRIGWQGRYQSSQDLSDQSPGISRELISPDKTGARFYNDVSLSYRLRMGTGQDATLSFGVTNLLNVHLPAMSSVQAISATAGGFDQFGPVVRAGLEVNF